MNDKATQALKLKKAAKVPLFFEVPSGIEPLSQVLQTCA